MECFAPKDKDEHKEEKSLLDALRDKLLEGSIKRIDEIGEKGKSISDWRDSIANEIVKNGISDEGEETSLGNIETNEKIDDNGKIYTKDGELLPNTTYTINENTYTTDEKGRIKSCESNPKNTPENQRDTDAQTSVGGEDRKSNDQGGHIVGRDMGGDGGIGNLIPMDSRINQSDYKRMENEIKKAIADGKDPHTKTEMIYSSDSERPDKIIVTVTIDGKDTVYTYDNNLEGSLTDKLKDTCNESDIKTVQQVLNETGGQISSTKEEYDTNGNLMKTTVMITYVDDEGKNFRRTVIINNNGGV